MHRTQTVHTKLDGEIILRESPMDPVVDLPVKEIVFSCVGGGEALPLMHLLLRKWMLCHTFPSCIHVTIQFN